MAGQRLQCVVAVRSLLGIASLVHARACFVSFSVLGRVCCRVLAQASEFFAFSGPPCVAAMVACVRACFVVACIGGSLAQGPAVMNVRLSPAARSLPDLAEEIAGLDAARRSLEEAGLKALDEAFAQALGSAGPRIEEVVSQSSALAGGWWRVTVGVLKRWASRRARGCACSLARRGDGPHEPSC